MFCLLAIQLEQPAPGQEPRTHLGTNIIGTNLVLESDATNNAWSEGTNLVMGLGESEPEPEPTMRERIWAHWKAGGNTMYVILFFSLMTVSCLLERLFRCTRRQIVPDGFSAEADALWKSRKHEDLVNLCEKDRSILAQAIKYIVVHRHNDLGLVSTGAGDVAASELKLQLQRAYPLAIAATLSPLAGLFGTVIGMIESFQIVAVAGSLGDASLLADGISKALITTAAGLFVAIVALGFYHYFRSKTNVFGVMIEKQVNDLISVWMLREEHGGGNNEN